MFVKKLLGKMKGFSLVELMIGMGIAGGVALAASHLMSEHYSNQKYLEVQGEIAKLTDSIQNAFNNKELCARNFNQFPTSETFSTPKALSAIVSSNGTPLYTIPGSFGSYSLAGVTILASAANATVKDIVLAYTWPNKKFIKNMTITKTISVFAQVAPAGIDPVASPAQWTCGEVVTDSRVMMKKELCESLIKNPTPGSTTTFVKWDTATSRCVINEFKCPYGQIPSRMSSLGNFVCTPTTAMLNPADMVDGTPTSCPETSPDIKLVFDGSKYRIVCSGTPSCTPVNGGWSNWTDTYIPANCPTGPNPPSRQRTRVRNCTNPSPSCGGTCGGLLTETVVDTVPCPCTPSTTCAQVTIPPNGHNYCDECGNQCAGSGCDMTINTCVTCHGGVDVYIDPYRTLPHVKKVFESGDSKYVKSFLSGASCNRN